MRYTKKHVNILFVANCLISSRKVVSMIGEAMVIYLEMLDNILYQRFISAHLIYYDDTFCYIFLLFPFCYFNLSFIGFKIQKLEGNGSFKQCRTVIPKAFKSSCKIPATIKSSQK